MLEIEEEETNLCWELVAVLMRLIEGFTWREDMKDYGYGK